MSKSTLTMAMHIHSEWSYDAKWSLNSLAMAFAERGFDILLMTEHDKGFTQERWEAFQIACREASTDRITLYPGIEYSDAENCVHILVWGEDIPFLGEERKTLDLLQDVSKHGGIAVMAHPWRRKAWELFTPEWAKLLVGVELWNRKADGIAPSPVAHDLLSTYGLNAFVGHDFHTKRQFFPMGLVMDADNAIEFGELLKNLRSGRFSAHVYHQNVTRFSNKTMLFHVLRSLESLRVLIRTIKNHLVGMLRRVF